MTQNNWAGQQLPPVKSKADLVYESLHAAIANGELRPGERMNMDELARNFGVSKIPVREAVRRLESEGLLVSRAHSGVSVTEVDKKEMRGVFLARGAIEELVGRLAAENADETLLANLDQVQDAIRKALDTGAVTDLPRLNSRFHHLLAEASGYRILGELTEHLMLTIRRYRIVAPIAISNWRSVVEEHELIIEALRAGDPDAAARAALEHTSAQARHEVPDED
ncbi:GntR family transcriptional regulator [Streptomyces bobili]|uniref:GntR family transcriptional regulator n=1 Tax=Streptomyces bobili TaxID=67280 RepID=UPI00340C161C